MRISDWSSDVCSSDLIRAQIAWQGVIQRRVRPNVEIAPEEVEEVVARLAARRGTVERRVAEIFVPIESAAQEDEGMANARRLFDELRPGANFAGFARDRTGVV